MGLVWVVWTQGRVGMREGRDEGVGMREEEEEGVGVGGGAEMARRSATREEAEGSGRKGSCEVWKGEEGSSEEEEESGVGVGRE